MIRAAIHRLLGGRLINLDTPRLSDWSREKEDSRDQTPEELNEAKNPIDTVVRRILMQMLSDGSPLLTLAHTS